MIKYFTIEDLLKHYLQKKFHILSFFAFIITIEGIVALSIGYFFHIEASEMPKLDSDITQFFQRFLTELRLILVLVLYFFSRRKKNAPERKVQKDKVGLDCRKKGQSNDQYGLSDSE